MQAGHSDFNSSDVTTTGFTDSYAEAVTCIPTHRLSLYARAACHAFMGSMEGWGDADVIDATTSTVRASSEFRDARRLSQHFINCLEVACVIERMMNSKGPTSMTEFALWHLVHVMYLAKDSADVGINDASTSWIPAVFAVLLGFANAKHESNTGHVMSSIIDLNTKTLKADDDDLRLALLKVQRSLLRHLLRKTKFTALMIEDFDAMLDDLNGDRFTRGVSDESATAAFASFANKGHQVIDQDLVLLLNGPMYEEPKNKFTKRGLAGRHIVMLSELVRVLAGIDDGKNKNDVKSVLEAAVVRPYNDTLTAASAWNIEHIFSQDVTHYATAEKHEDDLKFLQTHLHYLGNLSPLECRVNSRTGNKAFSEKVALYLKGDPVSKFQSIVDVVNRAAERRVKEGLAADTQVFEAADFKKRHGKIVSRLFNYFGLPALKQPDQAFEDFDGSQLRTTMKQEDDDAGLLDEMPSPPATAAPTDASLPGPGPSASAAGAAETPVQIAAADLDGDNDPPPFNVELNLAYDVPASKMTAELLRQAREAAAVMCRDWARGTSDIIYELLNAMPTLVTGITKKKGYHKTWDVIRARLRQFAVATAIQNGRVIEVGLGSDAGAGSSTGRSSSVADGSASAAAGSSAQASEPMVVVHVVAGAKKLYNHRASHVLSKAYEQALYDAHKLAESLPATDPFRADVDKLPKTAYQLRDISDVWQRVRTRLCSPVAAAPAPAPAAASAASSPVPIAALPAQQHVGGVAGGRPSASSGQNGVNVLGDPAAVPVQPAALSLANPFSSASVVPVSTAAGISLSSSTSTAALAPSPFPSSGFPGTGSSTGSGGAVADPAVGTRRSRMEASATVGAGAGSGAMPQARTSLVSYGSDSDGEGTHPTSAKQSKHDEE